jgi:hypothetical protein
VFPVRYEVCFTYHLAVIFVMVTLEMERFFPVEYSRCFIQS